MLRTTDLIRSIINVTVFKQVFIFLSLLLFWGIIRIGISDKNNWMITLTRSTMKHLITVSDSLNNQTEWSNEASSKHFCTKQIWIWICSWQHTFRDVFLHAESFLNKQKIVKMRQNLRNVKIYLLIPSISGI